MTLALLILLAGIGAAFQRLAGLGFALLISPFIVLLFGPQDGVLLVNILGIISTAIVIARVWRRINWRKYAQLAIPAVVVSIPASIWSAEAPVGPLYVIVGALIFAGLTTTVLLNRAHLTHDGTVLAMSSGAISGFTSAVSGSGGPAVTAYGVLSNWEPRAFAATLQPFFITSAGSAVLVKVWAGGLSLPAMSWMLWVGLILAIIGGIVLGEFLERYVRDSHARWLIIGIALVGSIMVLIRGLSEIFGA